MRSLFVILLVTFSFFYGGRPQILATMGDEMFAFEGAAGTISYMNFPVYLSQPVTGVAVVTYSVVAGTAVQGVNYELPNNGPLILSFSPGSDQENISIPIIGNNMVEPTETFDVILVNGTGVTVSFPTGSRGYILNDDGVSGYFNSTGSAIQGVSDITFNITLSQVTTYNCSFSYRAYSKSSDSAVPGVDYDNVVSTANISAGQDFVTVDIPISTDSSVGPDKTFTVEIYLPNYFYLVNAQGVPVVNLEQTMTIINENVEVMVSSVSQLEGTGTTPVPFVFNLSLSRTLQTGEAATVSVQKVDITTSSSDFADLSALNQIYSFSAGQLYQLFTLFIQPNPAPEQTKQFQLVPQVLTSTPYGLVNTGFNSNGLGTIINEQGNLTVALIPPSINFVVNESSGTLSFLCQITGSNAGGPAGSFLVSVSSLSALNQKDFNTTLTSKDFLIATQNISWGAGVTPSSFAFNITMIPDAVVETTEYFSVSISNLNLIVGTGNLNLTYSLIDTTVYLSVSDASPVIEGSGQTQPVLLFPVTLSIPATFNVTIGIQYANLSGGNWAVPGVDFTGPSSISLTPGQTSATITVTTLPNSLVEPNKTVSLSLVNVTAGVTLGNTIATGVIVNDDIYIYAANVSTHVGQAGTATSVQVTIFSSDPFPSGSTVTYVTQSGTAIAGTDFIYQNVTINLPVGNTETTVTIILYGNSTPEPVRQFTVNLYAGVGTSPGPPGYGVITILNNNGPTLSCADASALENTGSVVFTLVLSSPAVANSSVYVSTGLVGTAIPGTDFVPVIARQVSFTTGSTTATFTVIIIKNSTPQPTKTFTLNFALSSYINIPSNLVPNGIIINNNGVAYGLLNSSQLSMAAGRSGYVNFTFVIGPISSGTPDSRADVAVETISQTAIAGVDFAPINYTLKLTASPVTVTVKVYGNTLPNPSLYFQVKFYWPDYVALGSPATDSLIANATILGDNFYANITGYTGYKGFLGDPLVPFIFNVTFSGPASIGSNITYQTQDGSALGNTTTGINSYIPAKATYQIPTGSLGFQITVFVIPNNFPQPTLNFSVVLLSGYLMNVGTPSSALGVILNDIYTLNVTDQYVLEGHSINTVVLTYSISGPAPTGSGVTVTTVDGTALNGTDYTGFSQWMPFVTGATTFNISVVILGNNVPSATKKFTIMFSNQTRIYSSQNVSTITILNDNGPTINVAGASALEGNNASNPNSLVFVVTASSPVTAGSGFYYKTQPITSPPDNYVQVNSWTLVNFTTGATNVSITVLTIPNTIPEATVFFQLLISLPQLVTLSNPSNGVITAIGEVINDDGPVVTINDIVLAEGTSTVPGAVTPFVFMVNLNGSAPSGASVSFQTVPGTATYPSDYTTLNGSINFTTGSNTGYITINVVPNSISTPSSYFFITLNTPNFISLGNFTQAKATISNDDEIITISPASIWEGYPNTTTQIIFNVTISAPAPPVPASFTWMTVDGTALAGINYQAAASTFTFPAGSLNGTIPITVFGTNIIQPNVYFNINVTSVSNAVMNSTLIVGTIITNDVIVSVLPASFYEGDSTYTYLFPIMQNTMAQNSPNVTYQVNAGNSGSEVLLVSPTQLALNKTGLVTYINFTIHANTIPKPDLYFTVTLTGCQACQLGNLTTANITLWSDDYTVQFTSATASVLSTAVTQNFSLTIQSSNPLVTSGPNPEVTVNTVSGTAQPGTDYVDRNTMIIFSSGQSSAVFTVPIIGTTNPEPTLYFSVVLHNPIGIKIGTPGLVNVSILNDNARVIMVSDPRSIEGGNTRNFITGVNLYNLTYVITLSGPAPANSSITYETKPGNAIPNYNYIPVSGFYNFTLGQTSTSVNVSIIANYVIEPALTVYLVIDSFTGELKIDSQSTGTGTIINDDFKAYGIHGVCSGTLTVHNPVVE